MIRFMRYWYIYLLISASVLVPGIYSLAKYGLKPALDFTGGTLLEVRIKNDQVKVDDLKKISEEQKLEVASITKSSQDGYIIKMKPIDNEQKNKLVTGYKDKYKDVSEVRFETVGPVLGKELLSKTYIAALVAIVSILLYVAYAFKNIRFGVSAILALVHDLLVVLGIFSILGKVMGVEVDALFITAVLTAMSFSMHDTIVVFDRIREYRKKSAVGDFETQINMALTETMGRSLNNSLTIIFMLLALFLLGGETVKWFVLALLIGTISGSYSSPFVATPILYLWYKLRDKKS